jgi:Tfp pilus assembly protein PilO
MRRLSRFETVGLMAVLIVACAFFYMKRVYEPQEKVLRGTVQRLNKVIAEVNNLKETPSAVAVERTLKKNRRELEEINKKLKGTAVRTGAEREVTELLSRINEIMESHRLAVNTLSPKGKVAGGFLDWNLFEVDMEASFYAFVRFLNELLVLPDAVKIEGIRMENGIHGHLHITMRLMI